MRKFEKKKIETFENLTVGTKQNITSAILNEERPIIISLPKDYENSNADYPVLYLTDGLQNIWHAPLQWLLVVLMTIDHYSLLMGA